MPVPADFTSGAPCWIDLVSSDPDKATEFYGTLFGWQSETIGEEDGTVREYRLFSKDGLPIAGLVRNDQGQFPDAWATYLATEDIAATARKVAEAGGRVLREPTQVGEQGSLAVFADPGGAVVCGWQPEVHQGFGLSAEPGAPCWFELLATDYDAAVSFYTRAFGWKPETMSDTGGAALHAQPPVPGFHRRHPRCPRHPAGRSVLALAALSGHPGHGHRGAAGAGTWRHGTARTLEFPVRPHGPGRRSDRRGVYAHARAVRQFRPLTSRSLRHELFPSQLPFGNLRLIAARLG